MIQLNYQKFGIASNPAIFFLHGFMGSSADFDSICKTLSEQYFCVAIDLPGHGQTIVDSNEDYTIEQNAVELIHFLEEKNIKKPHLAGYSLGGRIALYLAVQYPDYFSKIILESASPGLKTEPERTERQLKDSLLARRLQMQPLKEFIENWYEMPLFDTIHKDKETYAALIQSRLSNKPELLSRSLTYVGTGSQPSLWDKLPAIQNDLLLITGAEDAKFCVIAEEMKKINDRFQHTVIDGCGHNVHFENMNVFIDRITDFINNE